MIKITAEDIQNVYTMEDAIASVKKALVLHEKGQTTIPVRTSLPIDSRKATCLFMPGAIESLGLIGIKIVSVFPQNRARGLENVPAQMILLDGETGYMKAMIDGTRLTEMRTGAITAVATDLMAPVRVEEAACIGTGGQAPCQLEGLLSVRKVGKVRIAARDFEKTKKFAARMTDRFRNRFETVFEAVETPEEAVEKADVVYTVTTSQKPVVAAHMLKERVHLNAVGSFRPDMQELDDSILERASFVMVDNREGAMKEAGDLLIPLKKGVIEPGKLGHELGAYMAGDASHGGFDGLTVFKTVGFGALDLVVAGDILEKVGLSV